MDQARTRFESIGSTIFLKNSIATLWKINELITALINIKFIISPVFETPELKFITYLSNDLGFINIQVNVTKKGSTHLGAICKITFFAFKNIIIAQKFAKLKQFSNSYKIRLCSIKRVQKCLHNLNSLENVKILIEFHHLIEKNRTIQHSITNEILELDNNNLDLSKNYTKLFFKRVEGEVILECKDGTEHAHEIILTTMSEYFKISLNCQKTNMGKNKLICNFNTHDVKCIEIILFYFYTGNINPNSYNYIKDHLVEIIYICDFLQIPLIMKNITKIVKDDVLNTFSPEEILQLYEIIEPMSDITSPLKKVLIYKITILDREVFVEIWGQICKYPNLSRLFV